MKFLSINTAGEAVEAALYADGKIFYKTDASFKKAGTVLLSFIDELLHAAQTDLKDLAFIAPVTGPGSFTGIRIGLTTARAFAQFTQVGLVPVTHCEVLSYNAVSPCETVITLSDAANGLAYVAAFDGKTREVLMPPKALKTQEIAAFIRLIDEPHIVCADSVTLPFAAGASKNLVAHAYNGLPLIAAANAAYKKRGCTPYAQVVPLYVRTSQAEEAAL
ncbi:MAG: tRNA (adenosine(37)-N6)-threonylcarbamoyltransferase complex dimerization subunit type 1 TsaB [Firmicutes bacterium]|nr:tRNA (adenosine(37)-N6)-threonylcarbamoyltransferase complex dimerization subunit type 1 TsaB [Bacillota bacterium]